MAKLTFKKAEKLFREHWRIIAEDGLSLKGWAKEKALIKIGIQPTDFPRHNCFACEYNLKHNCDQCPVDWPNMSGDCGGSSLSPYILWERSRTKKDRQKYAAQIRDLPWTDKTKKGVK